MYYILLAGGGLWPLLAKLIFGKEYSWAEIFTQIIGGFVVAYFGWSLGTFVQATRTEILNGEVTGKYSQHVSCTHDYRCNCRWVTVGEGKDKHKEEQCDTCYEHAYDVDWWVTTNLNDFSIPRVDRRGTYEPPRWTVEHAGLPVAQEHDYQNYVAAQKSSLFHQQVLEMKELPDVPAYPRVFDIHYANRVLPVGITLPDLPQWQMDLANLLKELGPSKQANITVIIANTPSQNYRNKVEAAWEGGNKNDIIVVIGVQEDLKILWADTITLAGNSGNEGLQVSLRNDLMDLGTIDRTKVLSIIANNVRTQFVRTPMKEFEYLGRSLEPATWYQVTFTILFVILQIGVTVIFRRIDLYSSSRAQLSAR